MKFLLALLTGIGLQLVSKYVFDATPSEAYITYLIGFIGALIYFKVYETKTSK